MTDGPEETGTNGRPAERRPDEEPRRRAQRLRRPRRRRRLPALALIVLVGAAAVAGAYLVARALDSDRPHGRYLIGGWTFGDRDSLRRAVAADALDEVSVDWLQSHADGTVGAPRLDTGFIAAARDADCDVMVTLTDYDPEAQRFDAAIAAAILATPQSRARHVAAVAEWCERYGVDGVDVDWEALAAGQRVRFARFVEELARRLHADGRRIAVDVYPKTREPGAWDGPRAQDWKRLGTAVDQFRIMTYNYSGSWSGPGPISPPGWIDDVLTFAETRMEPGKVVMGLGFYGRAWQGKTTTDLVWADVRRIRAEHDPKVTRATSQELKLVYRQDEARRTAYFPDAKAIDAKLAILVQRHPDIAGIYAWCMGQEDPRVWQVLHRRLF